MSIDLTTIIEGVITSVSVLILVWLISLVRSEKSRRFSLLLWKKLRTQWRIVIVCSHVIFVTTVVHVAFSDWNATTTILVCITTTWVVFLLVNRNKQENILFYDFRKPLQKWKVHGNWTPELDTIKGTKLEPHTNLTQYIINSEVSFFTGTIDCDVILEKGAILDIIFRGKIGVSFYMARLDTRIRPNEEDIYDCILFSQNGNTGWEICNKTKGQSGNTSPTDVVVKMKIICTRKTSTLIVNGYKVDVVDNLQTKMEGNQIVIFTELSNAYLQKLQITQVV